MQSQFSRAFFLLFVSLTLIVSACSEDKKDDKKKVRANPDVAASFKLNANNKLKPGKNFAQVSIAKDALEKEFLLQAELLTQTTVPQFKNLKSRIVSFKLVNNLLYLLEATQGHVVTNELPVELVLASFPVVATTKTDIVFDFNAGMSAVYTVGDWRASDVNGPGYGNAKEFISAPLAHSYLSNAYLSARNELVLTQVGQVRDPNSGINTAIETRYYLSPYLPDENYVPAETTNFKRAGFFEVAPQLNLQGLTSIYATRWNPSSSQKIVYAVSANTPAEYKQAVRDGALYWNRAFGEEKVQVIDAPVGVSAPHPDYNILQWVTWDTAGMAYADAQMDPRTGQIHKAQVFMTSVFATATRYRARQILRKMNASSGIVPSQIRIAGIESSVLCNEFDTKAMVAHLESVLATATTDEEVLRASQDMVRHVMAHEVGHTLGLRHNFAGNLDSNRNSNETMADFEKYLKTDSLDASYEYSNSQMEYTNTQARVLSGKQIRGGTHVNAYDKAAIELLYKGKEVPAPQPLFCTDSHADQFLGCVRGDAGYSPIEEGVLTVQSGIENVPRTLLEKLIAAKFPSAGVRSQNFDEVLLNPSVDAKAIYANRKPILDYLTREAKDLRVHRSYTKIDSTNSERVIADQLSYAEREVSRLGDLNTVLPAPDDSLVSAWNAEFDRLISSDSFRKSLGLDEEAYELTNEDVKLAKQIAAGYFDTLANEMALADIASLQVIGELADTDLTDSLALVLAERIKKYVFSTTGQKRKERVTVPQKGDDGKFQDTVVEVDLPIYKYDLKTRSQAASLFSGRKTQSLIWAIDVKAALRKEFTDALTATFHGTDINTVKTTGHSKYVATWVAENKKVLGSVAQ